MSLVDRYVAANFIRGLGIVLMLLLALFSFLSLTEALEDVGQGSFTAVDAFSMTLLGVPALLIELLPVSALLGSLISLGAMANHRELIALQSLGVSPLRVAMALMKVVLIIGILAPAGQYLLIPTLERQVVVLQAKAVTGMILGGGQSELWTRGDASILRVGQLLYGRIPRDIELFELGESGRLVRVIRADQADIGDDGAWLLHGVRQTELQGARIARRYFDHLQWPGLLSAEQISAFILPASALPVPDLYRYIQRLEENGLNAHHFRIILFQQLGFPVTLLAMSILGLPFVMGSVRGLSAGLRVAVGAVVGIVFYLTEKITEDVALILELNPMAAAMAPELLLLGLALVGLRKVV